jgi:hypothetical protein
MKNILVVLTMLLVGNLAFADGEVEACISVSRYFPHQAWDNVGVYDLTAWLPVAKEAGAVISYGYFGKTDYYDKMRVVFKDAAFFNLAKESFKHMGYRDSVKHMHDVTVSVGPCQ